MATLTGVSEIVKGQSYEIHGPRLTIGRSDENQVSVSDGTVSGHHCTITVRDDGIFVRDEESTNGTRVNSAPVEGDTRLRPKDVLQVGSVEFIFDDEGGEAESDQEDSSAEVEESSGPVAAPSSFGNISPFSKRGRDLRGLWVTLIVVIALAALAGVALFVYKLITTG